MKWHHMNANFLKAALRGLCRHSLPMKSSRNMESILMNMESMSGLVKCIEQCPQFSSISQDGNTGGSANQEPDSDCSLDGSQIYDISRGRKVVVSGTNCVMSFN